MRRILKSAAVITVVTLLLTGCEGWFDIGEPEIITPTMTAGSEVDGNQVKFMWHSVENATGYAIEIAEDNEFGSLLYTDSTIIDTFCYVSTDSFEWDTTYYWRVKASDEDGWGKWSDITCFDLAFPGLDLDTTYFPFGLGYEWCYEKYSYSFQAGRDPQEIEEWDTTTILVVDSILENDALYFELDGAFLDLLNPVGIKKSMIYISTFYPDSVDLIPCEVYKRKSEGDGDWGCTNELDLKYFGDTLRIISTRDAWYYPYSTEYEYSYMISRRTRGIGAVFQKKYDDASFGGAPEQIEVSEYRLLYFYNGTDTLYKTE